MRLLAVLTVLVSQLAFANPETYTVTYSDEIIEINDQYNFEELESMKVEIVRLMTKACPKSAANLNIQLVNLDVDLFVSWNTWVIQNAEGEAVAAIEVTFWQAPGSYKIDKFELYRKSCQL